MQSQHPLSLETLPTEIKQYIFSFFQPWEAKALACVSQDFKSEFKAFQIYEKDRLQEKVEKLVKAVNQHIQNSDKPINLFIKVHGLYSANNFTIKLDDIVYFNEWELLLSTAVNLKDGSKHVNYVIKTEDLQLLLRGASHKVLGRVIPVSAVENHIATSTDKQLSYAIYKHARLTFNNLFPEIRALHRLYFDEREAISFGRFGLINKNIIGNEDYSMAIAILDYLANQKVISYRTNGLGYIILKLKQQRKDGDDIKILLDINIEILNPHKLLTVCLQAKALYNYTQLLLPEVVKFFKPSVTIEKSLKAKMVEGGMPFILGYFDELQKANVCYFDGHNNNYYTLSADSAREALLRTLVFLDDKKIINIAAYLDQEIKQSESKQPSLR